MTIGKESDGSTVIRLSPAETARFEARQAVVKYTGSASGSFAVTVEMTRKSKDPYHGYA